MSNSALFRAAKKTVSVVFSIAVGAGLMVGATIGWSAWVEVEPVSASLAPPIILIFLTLYVIESR